MREKLKNYIREYLSEINPDIDDDTLETITNINFDKYDIIFDENPNYEDNILEYWDIYKDDIKQTLRNYKI